MQRREFIGLVGGAAAWQLIARAQQPVPMVGLLNSTPSSEQPRVDAFIKRFGELGWNNGRTVAIEFRWSEGRAERVAEIAAEFVRLKVNVIVTAGAGPVSAVRQVTQLIPIVFAIATDPVVPALSPLWRGQAEVPPACRTWGPILLPNASNFCVGLLPVSPA